MIVKWCTRKFNEAVDLDFFFFFKPLNLVHQHSCTKTNKKQHAENITKSSVHLKTLGGKKIKTYTHFVEELQSPFLAHQYIYPIYSMIQVTHKSSLLPYALRTSGPACDEINHAVLSGYTMWSLTVTHCVQLKSRANHNAVSQHTL